MYFYEAPNKKIESMLQKIQKQLAHMQKDIDILKDKKNATKGNTVFLRIFLITECLGKEIRRKCPCLGCQNVYKDMLLLTLLLLHI